MIQINKDEEITILKKAFILLLRMLTTLFVGGPCF